MVNNLNEQYRKAAQEFADRVTSALGDEVDSIVLYGSVARGEATEESDIDILVVSQDDKAVDKRICDILAELDRAHDYAFFISLVHYSRERFSWLKKHGSPFITEVTRDGVILHDNKTFSRVPEDGTRVS